MRFWIAISLLHLAACATMSSVNGQEVYEASWPVVQRELGARAKFDLECDEQPSLTLMTATRGYPTVVGVSACQKRATYVREVDGYNQLHPWVLNVAH
jgi:hypothetical protein